MLTNKPVFLEQKLYFKVLRYLRDLYGDVFRARDEFFDSQGRLVARLRSEERILFFNPEKLISRATERKLSELPLERTYLLYCMTCLQFASAPFKAYFHESEEGKHPLEEIGHVNRRGFPKRKHVFQRSPSNPRTAPPRRTPRTKKTFLGSAVPSLTRPTRLEPKVSTQFLLAVSKVTIDGITINAEERRELLQRAGLLAEVIAEATPEVSQEIG